MLARMFLMLCSRFGDAKPHGMPFAAEGKVPTRGFSAKKEMVWHDLQKFFISLFTSTDDGFNGRVCAQWVCSVGIYYVLNCCAQWESILNATGNIIVCSMERYSGCSLVNEWCAQQEIITYSSGNYWSAEWEFRCSTGSYVLNRKLLCTQQDIIQVLNGNSGAQWEVMCSMGIIMWSTGHYWGVQLEVMCSTGNYNVLNWTLLECSTGIIICSTGHYWGAQQEFKCSTGGYVLNAKL